MPRRDDTSERGDERAPSGDRRPEWEDVEPDLGPHTAESPYRPRPGDEIVEPLFTALVEERSHVELVEELSPDGTRRSRLAIVWERVRVWLRRS
ncbi:MAG: hypothetical protein R3F34_03250 [Planctomycetota bacterium]